MFNRLLVKKKRKVLSELTQEIPANGIITVGNDSSATVELKEGNIAPEQFVIVCEEGSMTLLCRVSGTAVNGTILPPGALHELQFGDEIEIAGYTLTAETAENNGSPQTENPEELAELKENEEIYTTPAASPEKSERSLNDVLENLRSEEKFYFLVGELDGADRRVYVEADEMWLGLTESGESLIASEPGFVEIQRAQIRKDWNGIVLYPLTSGAVRINDRTISEPQRLKNDDEIFLLPKEGGRFKSETGIKFHEPTSLLILDSILPKELPPPVSMDETLSRSGVDEIAESDRGFPSKTPASAEKPRRQGNIFGYFTKTEIIIMAIGTLITAGVIFLILEFY